MKKLFKYILIAFLTLPLIVSADFAVPFQATTSTSTGQVFPSKVNNVYFPLRIPYIIGTSTTATSTLPSLSATNFKIGTLNGLLQASNGFVTATTTTFATSGQALWSGSLSGNIYNANTGYVGIGTTTPLRKLDVTDGVEWIAATFQSTLSSATAPKVVIGSLYSAPLDEVFPTIGAHSSTLTAWNTLALNGDFDGNYGNVVIPGYVGVGTANPLSLLHVNGDNNGIIVDAADFTRYGLMKYADKSTMLVGADSGVDGNVSVALGRWSGGDIMNPVDVYQDLVVDTSGNVGIGTAAPGSKLDVRGQTFLGNADGSKGIITAETTGGVFAISGVNSGVSVYNPLILQAGNFPQLYLDTTGNIGIGTTSPVARLSLHAYSNQTYRPTLFTIASSTPVATTTHFTVLAGGNVGIGKAAPNYKLDISTSGAGPDGVSVTNTATSSSINASAVVQVVNASSTTGALQAFSPNSSTWTGLGIADTIGLTSTKGLLLATDSTTSTGGTSDLRFGAGGYDPSNIRMTVKAGGNIGIGTTTPYAKLSVESIIGSSDPLFVVASSTAGAGTTTSIYVSPHGQIGLGTTTPFTAGARTFIGTPLDRVGLEIYTPNLSAQAAFSVVAPLTTGVGDGKAFQFFVPGNSFARGVFYTDGSYGVGPGSGTRDTFLSRLSANTFMISSDRTTTGAGNLVVTGNAGVGTTSPFAKLSVMQTGGGTSPLFTVASSTGGAATSTALHINANGRIGVNTTSPGAMLQVNIPTAGEEGIAIRQVSGQTANAFEFQDTAGTPLTYIDSAGRFISENVATNDCSNPAIQIYENLIFGVRFGLGINASGNGTFCVAGTPALTFSTAAVIPALPVRGASGSAAAPTYSFSLSGATDNGMYRPSTDTLGFATAGLERFTISSGGLVGVGTTTPAAAFTVGTTTSATATTTIFFDSTLTKGTCLVMKDSDGSGYSFITVNNGVMTVSTADCR